jgi:hypothetical protein
VLTSLLLANWSVKDDVVPGRDTGPPVLSGLADEADLRLRFDVLTKTRQPELHRYSTARDRAANARLYRLAAEVLAAVEAGVLPPRVGWPCPGSPVRSRC